jgi:IS5 family transposase
VSSSNKALEAVEAVWCLFVSLVSKKKLPGDKGYEYGRCPKALRKRGITARIARGENESSDERKGGRR